MALTPIIELGVDEAYLFLTRHFGVTGLPPLESIENEDWGRDYLLSRFLEFSSAALAEAGLTREEDRDTDPKDKGASEPASLTDRPPSP